MNMKIEKISMVDQTIDRLKEYIEENQLKEGDRMIPLYPVECMEDAEEAGEAAAEPGEALAESGEAVDGSGEAAAEPEDSASAASDVPGCLPDSRYYTDSYYMGTEFYIEEPDDMLLETVPISGDGYLYGFMLTDVRQHIYYTDFIGMEAEDAGS